MYPPFCCKKHSRWCHHSLTTDACKTSCHTSLHTKSPTSTKLPAVDVDHGQPLSSCLSTHCCPFSSTQQPAETGSAQYLCWNSSSSRQKWHSGCWLLPDGATLCDKFDEYIVNRTKRHKSAPVCQKSCKQVQSNTVAACSGLVFWPTVYYADNNNNYAMTIFTVLSL